QLTPEVQEADAWLFDPYDPIRGLDQTVDVTYYLAQEADEVTVAFANDRGELLQTYTGRSDEEEPEAEEEAEEQSFRRGGGTPRASTRAGTNTLRWNMRLEGYTDFDGRIFWAAGNMGPAVVPGTYTVRLSVDGREVATRDFIIRMDPRIEGVTVEDLRARFELATRIRDRTSEANEAVIRIREIKAQIDERTEDAGDPELADAGDRLQAALSEVEGEIYQVRNRSNQDPLNFPIKLNNKLAALLGVVEGSENRPTDQSYEVFDYLSGLLQAELDRLDAVLEGEMVAFNSRLEEAGLEAIKTGGQG
ncbi:MAG: glycosyl hydrolase, partial [Longimicrobiales bacterium]